MRAGSVTAGLYVEMNRFIRAAANQRAEVIRAVCATAEVEQRAAAELAASEAPLDGQLSVEGTTFVDQQIAQAFDQALEASRKAWEVFLAAMHASLELALRHEPWRPGPAVASPSAPAAERAPRPHVRLTGFPKARA
jgi:hypothetical protein